MVAVVAGFLLRIPTVLTGAPRLLLAPGINPDEPTVVSIINDFPFNYLTNRSYVYGTAWQYMIGVLLLPVKFARFLFASGDWQSEDAYYHLASVVARLFSVAAGTLAIYLTWRLGARLFGRPAGAIAAALLAVSLYHCNNSAFATLDVPMSLLLVLLFLATIRAMDDPRLSAWAVCGAVAGVLMGTKVVAVFFALVPLVAIALVRSRTRSQTFRAMAVYIAVASVVLFITTPHMFFHPGEFLTYIAGQKRWVYDPQQQVSFFARELPALLHTNEAVGIPLILAFLGGAALSFRRRSAVAVVALLLIAGYYAFWGGFLGSRYVIAIAPLFCIFAGLFYASLVESPFTAVRVTGIALLGAALAVSAYQCVAGIDMRLNDTRPRAAAYIASTIPAGTSIGFLSLYGPGKRFTWRNPIIDFRKYRQTGALDRPSVLILTSYDVDDIEHPTASWRVPSPQLRAFYDAVVHSNRSGYRLVADFVPPHRTPIEFPPPEIRMYRLER